MIRTLRNSLITKVIIIYVTIYLIFGGTLITTVFAGGPSQPEMQGPSAVANSNLVDPFTGDFNYSVPLFEMGNIPLSLNYSAGITMDQESSWVGLGWSLNPGSITRNVRGLPDDFNNDLVQDELNIKDNTTVGITVGVGGEFVGVPGLDLSLDLDLQLYFNNYTGFGLSTSLAPAISAGAGTTVGISGSINSNSDEIGDFSYAPNISIGRVNDKGERQKFISSTASFSSLYGLRDISLNINAPVGIKDAGGETSVQNYGLGYSIPFSKLFTDQTYTPTYGHSFKNNSFTFNAGIGGELALFYGHTKLGGFVSTQKLEDIDKYSVTPAMGYLYYNNTSGNRNILTDINREKDGEIDENSLNLPLAQLTYDIYSVSSPGISGTFRAYRNDVGFLEEKEVSVSSTSGSGGVEVGLGDIYKAGIDIEITNSNSTSSNWHTGIDIDNQLQYSNTPLADNVNENTYFAMMNEMSTETDEEFLDKIGGKEPVRFSLIDNSTTTSLHNKFYTKDEASSQTIDENSEMRDGRLVRKTNITYLTKKQLNELYPNLRHKINENALDHHIAAMILTTNDGTKYVYALPVYNLSQTEVVFNVGTAIGGAGAPVVEEESNLVKYTYLQDSKENHSGQDYYFSKKTIPAYAHTYLLTEVFSPDYVDVTNDGPTNDDLGNFIRYTYGLDDEDVPDGVYEPNIPVYKWRTPSTDDEHQYFANYMEGEKAQYNDDKASYIFGTKEIWYLNKIETKEYTAFFHISPREDGYEAEGKYGGTGENQLYKLDEIELVTNAELLFDGDDYVPIKTVHFDYNYTLCNGYPGNATGGGKLTLTRVYFTYNNSFKGKYNYYEFNYDIDPAGPLEYDYLDNAFENPEYDFTAQDRWGNFKPDPTSPITNIEFPYVNQSDENIDNYAGAWALKQITEPSGDVITLEYESDDYAYVQDRQAANMVQIVAIKDNLDVEEFATDGSESYLFDPDGVPDEISNNLYLFFKLDELIPAGSTEANDIVRQNYVTGLSDNFSDEKGVARNLYFRFLLNTEGFDYDDLSTINDYSDEDELEILESEYVSGYASIAQVGAYREAPGTDYEYGYIQLNPQDVMFKGDDEYLESGVNPITKAAWQNVMQNKRYNIIDAPNPDMAGTFTDLLYALADINVFNDVKEIFYSPNNIMKEKSIGSKCILNRSYVRLLDSDQTKKGGGYRIKKVHVYDRWEEMSEQPYEILNAKEESTTYTTEYSYTKRGISSGVAAYEPFLGGDENPMRIPNNYNHYTPERYQYQLYKEHPFGESFFPASIVGYSHVEIKNSVDESTLPEDTHYKRNATGKTVQEFYTAKDFPVKVEATDMDLVIHHQTPVFALFYVSKSDLYSASQGYAIEINDMHGKPRSTTIYAEGNYITPLSRIEYFYKVNPDDPTELDNTVNTLNSKSEVYEKEVGVTYDFCVDLRKSESKTSGNATQLNFDGSAASAGWPIFSCFTKFSNSNVFVSLATTTKVISRNGILEKVVATQDGSTISTSNLMYDQLTGDAVLTSTQNEYGDPIYSFNKPADWIYKEMSPASINEGFIFTTEEDDDKVDWDNAQIIDNNLEQILAPGDIVRLYVELIGGAGGAESSPVYAWVYKETSDPDDPSYYFIDSYGEPIDFESLSAYFVGAGSLPVKGKVILSGRRNMSSMSAEATTTKFLPINTAPTPDVLQILPFYEIEEVNYYNVLNASATEYSNTWQKPCVRGSEPETICTCFGVTDVGIQFISFLENLILAKKLYNNENDNFEIGPCTTGTAGCDNPIIVDADDNYFYGFTPALETYFDDWEDPLEVLAWNNWTDDPAEGELQVWLSYTGSAITGCKFTLELTDNGLPVNLNSPTYFENVFGDPSEITFEYEIPTDPESCEPINEFTLYVYYEDNSVVDPGPLVIHCDDICIPFRDCVNQSLAPHYCSGASGDLVNPYLTGLLGIWKPLKSYMYKVDRTPFDADAYVSAADPNLRTDGLYRDFLPFWNWNSGDGVWEKDADNWQFTSQLMLYNPSVGAVESFNPLDIHSAELFGFNNSVAEMVANNSTYKTIGYEGFEDDNFITVLDKPCDFQHFDFPDDGNLATEDITNDYAHSGHFSLKIPSAGNSAADEVVFTTQITPPAEVRETYYSPETYDPPGFTTLEEDCIPKFSPDDIDADVTYLLTLWVHDADNLYLDELDNVVSVSVQIDGGTNLITTDPVYSAPIDEWRRYEYEFTIPSESTGEFTIKIENIHEGDISPIYIDDIRIQPKSALAKCYVYDFKTQWLMAEIDENHYATFYEYDEDGRLIRVKKETERGILTIQEGRYSVIKKKVN